jgi:hypothetical protein
MALLCVVVSICAFSWYGATDLAQRLARWQADRDSRAEVARRKALGYR